MSSSSGTDRTVTRDGVDLAVRDHGGRGPGLLLLHGFGRTLVDWADVAPRLTARHRVLAMDLRAHGHSGTGPWTLTEVWDDVAAVLDAFALPDAVVVGHSLGGMVAAGYAVERPHARGAVNLDGHGYGRPEQYPGLDRAYVERRLAEVGSLARAAAGRPLPEEALAAMLAHQTALGESLGIPAERMAEGLRRSLAESPEPESPESPEHTQPGAGRRYLRPEREPALQALTVMDECDLLALYRRTRRPLLVCRATQPNPSTPGLPWFDALMAAYGQGLQRDLAELASVQPLVTVEEVDATHALLLQRPELVAERVLAFTAGLD